MIGPNNPEFNYISQNYTNIGDTQKGVNKVPASEIHDLISTQNLKKDAITFSTVSKTLNTDLMNNVTDKSHKAMKLEISVYPTYGTEEEITVKGRVLESEKRKPVKDSDSGWRNLIRNLKMFDSDEIENASVNISFNGKNFKTKTDDEGFFNLKIKDFGPVTPGYNEVKVSLDHEQGKNYFAAVSKSLVTIQPKHDTTLGIVTDIDDTLQKMDVANKLDLLKNFLLKNQFTQEKIKGMSELFNSLDKRDDGKIDGDITYISGSPINVAQKLQQFIKHNNLPEGSMELKHMGLKKEDDSFTEQIQYKIEKIRTLLNTYPEKAFIFFGDSGEKDPEVYGQISKEFPGRVKGIYINNVTQDSKNSSRYEGMHLTNNSAEAAEDLLKNGFINQEDYEKVKKAVQ